ncbi:MAG: GxxExxY protein [Chloroflexota bacterium]|nr:GxxExxY protein [Chloroflexota bacterium]
MNERNASEEQDPLTYKIIGAAIEVHNRIGAGLLESLYEEAFCIELEHQQLHYERQKPLAVHYRGINIGTFKVDVVVENEVIVELKSVKELAPIHSTQIISYMKITGLTRGLLINFNVKQLTKGGIKRFVNYE